MSKRPSFRQSGIALVIVIWILTLLSIMAASFANSMRREGSIGFALKSTADAAAQAEAALVLAEFMLQQHDPKQRWRADGSIYQLLRSEGKIRIRIFAEAGKVDINAASETQLSAVLAAVSSGNWQREHVLNAVLDWRDADDDVRSQGAEKKQYQQAGRKYRPSNGPLQSLEELQLVLGMDAAMFSRLRPWLTIYSGQAEIDLRSADPELLAVLQADMAGRNVHDANLEQRLNALSNEEDAPDLDDQSLAGENQTYTIIVEAWLGDEASASLEAVVKSQSDSGEATPYQVLDWQQNPQGVSLFADELESRVITIDDEFTNNDRP